MSRSFDGMLRPQVSNSEVGDDCSSATFVATYGVAGTQQNAARGCLLGALIGDSVGSLLEFIQRVPSAQEVECALEMPGGGVWDVAPGQVTDDGELTLALARALVGRREFVAHEVALQYVRWFLSVPFDVGMTTHTALSDLDECQTDVLSVMLGRASVHCADSQANGSLMRQSALGVWSTRTSVAETVNAVRLDTCMTHPNLVCQWAGVAYVLAIRHLVLHPGQNKVAFAAASDIVQDASDEGAVQVRGWLQNAREGRLPAFYPHAGYVAIAFSHAFHHLYHGTPYVEALRATLPGGGDTDTNACIVGEADGCFARRLRNSGIHGANAAAM